MSGGGNSSIGVNNNLQVIESITQFLNGTQAVWNSITLPIPAGLVVYATDTTAVKIGDGSSLYGDLPVSLYFSSLIEFAQNNTTVLSEIAAAIAAHVAASNPHNQYVLKTSLSEAAILPDIVVYSPDAIIPQQLIGVTNLKTSTILKTSQLNHISQSAYCASSGYMTTTGTLAPSNLLVNAITNSGTASVKPTTEFLTTGALPVINYTFLKPRTLSQVVIFTVVEVGVASVTSVSITAGGVTQTVNITPGAVNTVVSGNAVFENIQVSEISISVLSISDGSQPNLSIGFNVLFGDTGADVLSVSGDTVVSFNYDGQIISLTPETDFPVSTASCVVGHEYLLALTTSDGITLTPDICVTAPSWGDGAVTYKNEFVKFTSDSDPYYGTTAITGVPTGSNYYEVYTTRGAIVPNSSVVTITQTFAGPAVIDSLNIQFPVTRPSNNVAYPTSIQVIITPLSGTVTTLNITPVFLNDGFTTYYNNFIDLSSYGSLIGFKIILTSANGTNCSLDLIDVNLSCLAYDTTKHTWSDGLYRSIVGSFNLLPNGVCQVVSQPVKNMCVVPINDLLPLAFYTQYVVPNTFRTKNIDVAPMTIDGNLTGGVLIQTVTAESITVLCNVAGSYALKIVRH